MRFTALDVRRDFGEVAIAEGGRGRRAGRVETTPATLDLFAQSLAADDQVVLEAAGNALAIARIIEPHVGRVVLANPRRSKAQRRRRRRTSSGFGRVDGRCEAPELDFRKAGLELRPGFATARWRHEGGAASALRPVIQAMFDGSVAARQRVATADQNAGSRWQGSGTHPATVRLCDGKSDVASL